VRKGFARHPLLGTAGLWLLDKLRFFTDGLPLPMAMMSRMNHISNNPALSSIVMRDRLGGGSWVPARFLRTLMTTPPAIEPEQFTGCPVLLAHPGVDRMTDIALSRRFFRSPRRPEADGRARRREPHADRAPRHRSARGRGARFRPGARKHASRDVAITWISLHATFRSPRLATGSVYDVVMIVCRALLILAVALPKVVSAQPGEEPPVPPPVDVQVDARVQFNPEAAIGATIERIAVSSPLIERIAKGTFKRARRAISIGPTVGAFAGYFPAAERSDYAITFGLGLELFKIPRAAGDGAAQGHRDQAREGSALLSANPQAANLDQLAQQIWDDTVKEVLAMENLRGKRIEKPRLTVALEANRLLDSEVWMTRLRAGLGISKLTLAGTTAVAFTDPETSIYAGVELVLHVMMSSNPRSSVADVFVRADFEVRNRDLANADFYGIGVRYLVELLISSGPGLASSASRRDRRILPSRSTLMHFTITSSPSLTARPRRRGCAPSRPRRCAAGRRCPG
jgi:hypothetical protein